jgi:hypothetical protein
MTSITAFLLPFVTYLLTLSRDIQNPFRVPAERTALYSRRVVSVLSSGARWLVSVIAATACVPEDNVRTL